MYCHIGFALAQAQDDITEGLRAQLVKLRREKDASDRALQNDFQKAQDGAAAAHTSLSRMCKRCIELYQEMRSLKDSLAEAHTAKVNSIQVSTAA